MLNKEYYKNTPLCEIIKEVPCSMNSYEFEQWLNSEHPILDKKEKDYLRNIVLPFYDRVVSVTKSKYSDNEYYIKIVIKSKSTNLMYESMILPVFITDNAKEDDMYTGMKRGKEYTLIELGIFK